MRLDAQAHKEALATRQQRLRLFLAVIIVSVWLAQVGWVTYHAVIDEAILVDVEKFIGLIFVTGAVVNWIVPKLWPESEG